MKIRRLGGCGDVVQELAYEDGMAQIRAVLQDPQQSRYTLVYDEDEREIVTRATMGQLKPASNVTIMPATRGG